MDKIKKNSTDLKDDEGQKIWYLIGLIVIAGFAIVGITLYFMIPKLNTVTGSDMTAIVTALTTLIGTLIGTLVGYQSGAAQGKLQLTLQNEKVKSTVSQLAQPCQEKFHEVYFKG
jgi:hypothetical protein